MKKIIRYLRYAFRLLKLNIGTLLVFELLYKFVPWQYLSRCSVV